MTTLGNFWIRPSKKSMWRKIVTISYSFFQGNKKQLEPSLKVVGINLIFRVRKSASRLKRWHSLTHSYLLYLHFQGPKISLDVLQRHSRENRQYHGEIQVGTLPTGERWRRYFYGFNVGTVSLDNFRLKICCSFRNLSAEQRAVIAKKLTA